MVATIYNFPNKKQEPTYNVRLFNEEEADVLLICMNIFSEYDHKFNYDNLDTISSFVAIECLEIALSSGFFVDSFKNIISIILQNVELD